MNRQTRYYSYDKDGNIVSETDKNNNLLVRYIRDISGKAISMIQGTNTYYFVYNAHGDVTALTDGSGAIVATYSYDEFGNSTTDDRQPTTGQIYNPLRYSGANNAYHDTETGLYKMGARYYQSDIGRWLTRDSYKGEREYPASKNIYVYLTNNPINDSDSSGNMGQKELLQKYSRVSDIILGRYDGINFPGAGEISYWNHSMMRVPAKKRVYKGKKYMQPQLAEVIPSAPGVKPLYKTLMGSSARARYNELAVIRVNATAYERNQAVKLMKKYVTMGLPYSIYTAYFSLGDGVNCSEVIWRAWYVGSGGRINLANQKYVIKSKSHPTLKPDSFAHTSYTELAAPSVGKDW